MSVIVNDIHIFIKMKEISKKKSETLNNKKKKKKDSLWARFGNTKKNKAFHL